MNSFAVPVTVTRSHLKSFGKSAAASQIQFDYIVNRPMVPYYSELSTSMQTELQLVLLGQKTAQEALDGLQTLALDLANQ